MPKAHGAKVWTAGAHLVLLGCNKDLKVLVQRDDSFDALRSGKLLNEISYAAKVVFNSKHTARSAPAKTEILENPIST